ncbi:MAG: MBL fold metallo-hydrolase [Lachnospiraceae bacterium]|nr:MBL fold metallo-hydrolase [Lachnospiraceae bacterium]
MKLVSLSSGSKGNAALVCTENTKLLVDCGVSGRKANELLKSVGYTLDDIDALLITHEHSDHIKGVKRLMQAYDIPVYATGGTLKALADASGDEYFNYAGRRLMEEVATDRYFSIGDIDILPFRIYHDVAEPCAYRFEAFQENAGQMEHKEAAVLTDCGHFDDMIADHMKLLDAAILEANHDRGMLVNGPYPAMLKRRIMSSDGHLSNNASGQLLSEIISPKLKNVILGHLSHENNTPEKALGTVRAELTSACGAEAVKMLALSVAPQDSVSNLVII